MKHGEAKDRQYGAGAMGQGVENAHGIHEKCYMIWFESRKKRRKNESIFVLTENDIELSQIA